MKPSPSTLVASANVFEDRTTVDGQGAGRLAVEITTTTGEAGIGEIPNGSLAKNLCEDIACDFLAIDIYDLPCLEKTIRIRAVGEADDLVESIIGGFEAALLDAQLKTRGLAFSSYFGGRFHDEIALSTTVAIEAGLDDLRGKTISALKRSHQPSLHVRTNTGIDRTIDLCEAARREVGADLPVRIEFGSGLTKQHAYEHSYNINALRPDALIIPWDLHSDDHIGQVFPRSAIGWRTSSSHVCEIGQRFLTNKYSVLHLDLAVFNRPAQIKKVVAVCKAFGVEILVDATKCGAALKSLATHIGVSLRSAEMGICLQEVAFQNELDLAATTAWPMGPGLGITRKQAQEYPMLPVGTEVETSA